MSRQGSPPFVGHGPDGKLTAQDARALLAEWAASGATLAEFARGKGMHPQRLGWWKKKFARQSPPPPDPAPPRPAPAKPFLAVRVEPTTVAAPPISDAPFEVVLGARTLRVPQRFSSPALAELLTVLEAAR
jgi:hypothetical protein